MAIFMNARYRHTKHPKNPIAITKSSDFWTKEITVQWEDADLMPSTMRYPEDAFLDGTFEFVGYNDKVTLYDGYVGDYGHGCNHRWAEYSGLKEAYEYCEKCDAKRPIKDANEDFS
jgi:hypothetical protein